MTSKNGTMVSVRLEISATIYCPHPSVDGETIEEVAKGIISQRCVITPRFFQSDPYKGGPDFEVYSEVMDWEIEDDNRDENSPDEFSDQAKWWKDLEAKRK